MKSITLAALGDTTQRAVETLDSAPSSVTVVRRAADLAQLLAACQSGLARIALIGVGEQQPTATLIDRMRAVGVGVLAVAQTPEDALRLRQIGAHPLSAHADVQGLLDAVAAAVAANAFANGEVTPPIELPTPQGNANVSAQKASAKGPELLADAASKDQAELDETAQSPNVRRRDREKRSSQHQEPIEPAKQNQVENLHDLPANGGATPEIAELFEVSHLEQLSMDSADAKGPGASDEEIEVAEKSLLEHEGESDPRQAIFEAMAGKRTSGPQAQVRTRSQNQAKAPSGKVSALVSRLTRGKQSAHSRGKSGDGHGKLGAVSGTKPPVDSSTDPRGDQAQRCIAVWGPVGSPGRTIVAINVAAELALDGKRVLLIDADSYGASVAANLGLLDESATFAQACRSADQGLLNVNTLSGIASEVVFDGGSISLLSGLTRADRWPELRTAAIERVISVALALVDVVVIDCGFCVELDEELSFDSVAPRRNGATIGSLLAADRIIAVGSGDAVGIPRLIKALNELREVHGESLGADPEVVVNKVRKGFGAIASESEISLAWQRFGPDYAIAHFLPWEPEVTDKALTTGKLLAESAPTSALRKAIKGLACAKTQVFSKIPVAKSKA